MNAWIIIGGLIAAAGAVIAVLLGRRKDAAPAPVAVVKRPPPATPPPPSSPPWLALARTEIGFQETGVNLGIERYISDAHAGELGDPWCAIFINAMVEKSGYPGTRSAAARSFEDAASFGRLTGPALGAITTMWRVSPTSGLGHVFLYTGQDTAGRVWGIGGNEDDGVREAPHDGQRITGYWWPTAAPPPTQTGAIMVSGRAAIATKEV